jgi:cellulose synthase/poly-beta-1,6-N-acetylglucosamine synthase-like glycosyltransferase
MSARTEVGGSAGAGALYDYARFSTLAGDPVKVPARGEAPYRVQFKELEGSRPVRTRMLALFAFLFVAAFAGFVMAPSHWPAHQSSLGLEIASVVMAVNTGVIALFILINVGTMARATMLARDPVPVSPPRGLRVAFLTTIVPSKEPLSMVRATLEAAKRVSYRDGVDVWLLDEGDDPAVQEMCIRLAVFYFTRSGVERWNRPSGPFKANSKHGNYNAWLDAHGAGYDVMLAVDPDHVPMKNFARRFLGYFRDPDVAFVVGPQVYGNYSNFVTRAAESQQFLFHSVLQRAGNSTRSPMLVGTNNAVRIQALRQVGGFRDSVTEDLATSLEIHAARNPKTGRRWTSVYTPDVVAVGEGPSTFSDFFTQQFRWALGANYISLRRFWRIAHRLPPRQIANYALLLSYYPTTAIAWTLGILSCTLYLTLGVTGVTVPGNLWVMLYADTAALQVGLYCWNRRHNVSPHEAAGSSGVAGMFISMLATPIYVSSLISAVTGRRTTFVVTAKGSSARADTLGTFRRHLQWALVLAAPLLAAQWLEHDSLWIHAWAILSLAVCIVPLGIWRVSSRRRNGPKRRRREHAHQPQARTSRLAEGVEAL